MNKIDKMNMFTCDHCEFQVASSKIMDIHSRNFDNKPNKYSCDICSRQESNKNSLARHKKIVNDGVKFLCRKCNHQATTKWNLAQHKRAVHDGVIYPCNNATIKQHQKEIFLDTKWQYMMESNTLVGNASIKVNQK